MEDAGLMDVREAFQQLAHQFCGVRRIEALRPSLFDVFGERAAVDELHHNVELAPRLVRPKVAHDVLVLQRAHNRDLADQLVAQRACVAAAR